MLKHEREAQGMTLSELAKVTRISETALENIENNRFEAFDAQVFVRGFLRNYARQLSIPAEKIIQAYDCWMKGQKEQEVPQPADDTAVHSPTFPNPEKQPAAETDGLPAHPFRFAYAAIILIAVASVALSFFFMGTGEAEEGDVDFMIQTGESVESPFLISNTSEGWIAE